MTIDPAWRDFAAVWGAVLSTIIVLFRFIPSRPQFEIEPGRPPTSDLILRVINPAKNMRIVRERFRLKLSGKGSVIGIYTPSSRMCDAGEHGTLLLAVRGEEEKEVLINCLGEIDQGKNGRWIICFTWRGGWILPIAVPAFVYISTKRAAQINSAV